MIKIIPTIIDIEEYFNIEYPTSLLNYKKLVVRYQNNNIALFKFCYGKYKTTGKSFYIDPKTYAKSFEILVKYAFETLIQYIQTGKSINTFLSFSKRLRQFCSWCFDNKLNINTIKGASEAYLSYTLHLKSKLRQGKGLSHCADLQSCVRRTLTAIHDDKQMIIENSASNIFYNQNLLQRTQPSSSKDNAYQLKFYKLIFNQIADFLLKKRAYPFQIKLDNQTYNVLPTHTKFYSITSDSFSPMGFNHNKLREYTFEEFQQLYPNKTKGEINQKLKNIKNLLSETQGANHRSRYKLGEYAVQAFYMLFLANTGMNGSSAIKVKWRNNLEKSNERHKFVVFKNRANKVVEFEIEKVFYPVLKKYIELRSYMLKDITYDYLFFSKYGENASLTKKQLDGSWSSIINRYFRNKLDTNLPSLGSKILRVNKTNFIIEKYGIVKASNMMQNKISTILKYYTAQREETTNQQITDFFDMLNNRVFENNNDEVETIIGQCSKTDKIVLKNEFPVDCNNKQTCLFCKYYRCHLDKLDLIKIFSLQFILFETRSVASNEEQFLSIYKGLLSRIEDLLSLALKTKKISIFELNSIKDEVFIEEKLHPYWEHKYYKLLDMGVLK
ncbi:hypothetical protein [Aliarcobacter butzleri]|uniref:hypothetical protein n=1 Tax=Aliarcobacter butzleri TaxID=28197 RepID=UPI002B2497FD|nr:hypothetical protein [Aliarcobacter butzleri]